MVRSVLLEVCVAGAEPASRIYNNDPTEFIHAFSYDNGYWEPLLAWLPM
ncbi:hypothetical protein [Synechococcus sp. 1G10]|nr:hypothetical protein [Synechococcus sp. 1G10]